MKKNELLRSLKSGVFLLFLLLGYFKGIGQNPYPIRTIYTSQFVSSNKLTEPFPNDSCDYVNPFF